MQLENCSHPENLHTFYGRSSSRAHQVFKRLVDSSHEVDVYTVMISRKITTKSHNPIEKKPVVKLTMYNPKNLPDKSLIKIDSILMRDLSGYS